MKAILELRLCNVGERFYQFFELIIVSRIDSVICIAISVFAGIWPFVKSGANDLTISSVQFFR